MIISPIKAIEEGWIKGNIDDSMIQPNGIDFRLRKLYTVAVSVSGTTGIFFIDDKDNKKHNKYVEVQSVGFKPEEGDAFESLWLKPHTSYNFDSDLEVNIPGDIVAMLYTRSSLARNFIGITSGLYDSGFNGKLAGQLHNHSSCSAALAVGARIGQIYFTKAQSAALYNGSYQNQITHWTKKD